MTTRADVTSEPSIKKLKFNNPEPAKQYEIFRKCLISLSIVSQLDGPKNLNQYLSLK